MSRNMPPVGVSRAIRLSARTAVRGDFLQMVHQQLDMTRMQNARRRNALRAMVANELERLIKRPNWVTLRLIASLRKPLLTDE